ncbi:M50 family metallopeptidase [Saccharopolyspora sp. CA-218241]|uniref:M50 family metallopeptidase n=1 Tax=Saccharopolyspora sp. CA-218241 TaxID=3240027 RepID=UPI003D97D3C1
MKQQKSLIASSEWLSAAAHEAGHAVVASLRGFPVRSLRLWSENGGVAGMASIDINERTTDPEEINGYLLVSVAGHEAQARWATEREGHRNLFGFRDHGSALDLTRAGCRHDLDLFHQMRRRHPAALTEAAARTHARILLRRHWPRLQRLATRLARAKHLTY